MLYPAAVPSCVLITGATGDLGRAFAERFAAAGARLTLHGRNEEKLKALKDFLKTDCHTLCFDITDKAAIARAISSLPQSFSDVDCLINNAGLALGLDPAQNADLADWDGMVAANVTGLMHMTRHFLPGMVERRRGHIINIGSVAANWPYPGGNVYCATKAFVKQFSLALRADLHGTGVRVSVIEPGMVETQFSLVRFKGDKSRADAVYAGTNPLTPADIAETVFWTAGLPPHVNVNTLEIMPTSQSFGGLPVDRKK